MTQRSRFCHACLPTPRPASKTVTSRTLTLPRSGRLLTYELERKSVKNLNLRVRRDGTLHLSIPCRTAVAAAEAFLVEREDWILSALATVEARAAVDPTFGGVIGDSIPYLGGTMELVWLPGTPAAVEVDLDNRRLTARLPDPSQPQLRLSAVETFERAETERLVKALVAQYFPAFASRDVAYPAHIRVKHIKSRHGSCSPRTHSLNFAAKLCEYPLPFVEYVVVHELCHFLIPNHSAAFWREVAAVLPDYKERERLGKR